MNLTDYVGRHFLVDGPFPWPICPSPLFFFMYACVCVCYRVGPRRAPPRGWVRRSPPLPNAPQLSVLALFHFYLCPRCFFFLLSKWFRLKHSVACARHLQGCLPTRENERLWWRKRPNSAANSAAHATAAHN